MIEETLSYQLLQQISFQQNEVCHAIAFNEDGTIMAAGCHKLVKVFEFKDDKIREVQQLNGHEESVFCLQFMKKSNQLISGSDDATMMVWEDNNNNNSWQSIQVLKGHSSAIYCMQINQNEDMLISASYDETITFWQKQNNIWNSNQSIDCLSNVWSISLSDQEDKLIASVSNGQILVIQLQEKQWRIKQKIAVQQFGFRLSFINQDQFVFQPRKSQHLQIFNYNSEKQIFQKEQELEYLNKEVDDYALFSIRYIPQLGLIMVKHCDNVHLIKKSQDDQFKIEQSIKLDTAQCFGGVSDDGRYIAIWDYKYKEMQIRKFDY